MLKATASCVASAADGPRIPLFYFFEKSQKYWINFVEPEEEFTVTNLCYLVFISSPGCCGTRQITPDDESQHRYAQDRAGQTPGRHIPQARWRQRRLLCCAHASTPCQSSMGRGCQCLESEIISSFIYGCYLFLLHMYRMIGRATWSRNWTFKRKFKYIISTQERRKKKYCNLHIFKPLLREYVGFVLDTKWK